jgi:hypothetical protein
MSVNEHTMSVFEELKKNQEFIEDINQNIVRRDTEYNLIYCEHITLKKKYEKIIAINDNLKKQIKDIEELTVPRTSYNFISDKLKLTENRAFELKKENKELSDDNGCLSEDNLDLISQNNDLTVENDKLIKQNNDLKKNANESDAAFTNLLKKRKRN